MGVLEIRVSVYILCIHIYLFICLVQIDLIVFVILILKELTYNQLSEKKAAKFVSVLGISSTSKEMNSKR